MPADIIEKEKVANSGDTKEVSKGTKMCISKLNTLTLNLIPTRFIIDVISNRLKISYTRGEVSKLYLSICLYIFFLFNKVAIVYSSNIIVKT